MAGGVAEHLPFVPNLEAQMASSFVNRVTPANVGGMALNVRFLQKAGVPTTEAVTGVGLNSIAGAIVHVVLLVVFFAWAGQGGGKGFSLPGGSKALVIIAVVLGLLGVAVATRRGRHLLRTRVISFAVQAWRRIRRARAITREARRSFRRLDRVDPRLYRRVGGRGRRDARPPHDRRGRRGLPRRLDHRGRRSDARGWARWRPRWSPDSPPSTWSRVRRSPRC